jgi:hypothetical protein
MDTNGSVNHPPLANDDYYTTHEGVPVLTLPLANDYDVDGDPLTITVTRWSKQWNYCSESEWNNYLHS